MTDADSPPIGINENDEATGLHGVIIRENTAGERDVRCMPDSDLPESRNASDYSWGTT